MTSRLCGWEAGQNLCAKGEEGGERQEGPGQVGTGAQRSVGMKF